MHHNTYTYTQAAAPCVFLLLALTSVDLETGISECAPDMSRWHLEPVNPLRGHPAAHKLAAH